LIESRGDVSGILGSYENGTPNTTADIVFFVDNEAISDTDASAKIKAYTDELKRKGINANVIIKNLGVDTDGNIVPVDLEDITEAVEGLDTASFREGSNRYAFIITDDTSGSFTDLKAALDAKGLETSVITNDLSAWSAVIGGTDGKTYSLADFNDGTKCADVLRNIAADTNNDVNKNISVIESTTNIVSDMKKRLNALINVMLREINYIHSSGVNMKDPPEQGEDFFVTINSARPLEMGNIKLNPNLSNLSNIVSSKNGENGDNSIARELANLRNKEFIRDTTGILSLDGYYQSIILTMGNKAAEASSVTASQTVLVESAENSRTAISGVSMDEELSNMMKFKFAYDAAARALNVIDSMLDKIINGTGVVGR
jgi:flagellar hook-associated protein 1 FlgK